MTERQSGLRFDIYERVHLAEDTVGIKELDEVELVPHIQVYTEDEQAVLKGNLYLTGSYAGEAGEESRTLEHLIPVEITLPLNRIHDVNEVAVDIDNFDVDLLSPYSLNVTGVLTLRGIEMLSVPEESWKDEEETVFVHEARSYGDLSPAVAEPEAVEAAAEPVLEAVEAPVEAALAEEREEPVEVPAAKLQAEEARSEVEEAPAPAQVVSEFYVNADAAQEDEVKEVFAAEAAPVPVEAAALEAPEAEAVEEIQEEKKDLKIAFGSRPAPDASYHLKSLIHTGDVRTSAAAVAEDVEESLPAPKTDAIEWKRLFVKSESEEKSFRKVKVCIVQKEETLESISQRYGVNGREILLHNKLAEEDLAEGKVLFIPR